MLFKRYAAVLIAAALAVTSAQGVFADDMPEAPQMQNMGEEPPALPEGEMPVDGDMGPISGEEGILPINEDYGEAVRPDMPEGHLPAMPGGEQGGAGGDSLSLPFNDVSQSDWYYDALLKAYGASLISGTSSDKFSPKAALTGGAVLMILYRADGNSVSGSTGGNWYDEAVDWAEKNSVLSGAWSFDPAADLSREQMMEIIYNYLAFKGIDQSEAGDVSAFADAGEISGYALNAVKWLVGQGIINGDENGLRPKDSLTRAEAVYIIITVLEKYSLMNETGGMGGEASDGDFVIGYGGFGAGSQTVDQGTAANTITEDGTYSGETYTSTGDDENALRVEGATVTLSGITVEKSGGASSNSETGDFYGMNAALLATDGAQVTITNSTVASSAQNGNGVFSYGSGTVVNVSDTTITTTADNSGGIQTTGGGTTNAENLTVITAGSSAAAIRSDRGGGTVAVKGGSYTSNGYNSPAVYSTADITVSNAELTANNSEALVIEGENSITLNNCSVYGNMSDTKGTSSDENVHNIMIYQSMSGDAKVGTAEFSATGGSITSSNGDMFYITNTHAVISLSGVELTNKDDDALLMLISGNSGARGWGSAGANGAQAKITTNAQALEGDIEVDTVSNLTLSLENGSSLTGTINIIQNNEGGAAVDNNAVIIIDSTSTWTLTGNCVITSLENNGSINFGGYTITLADGTVLSE